MTNEYKPWEKGSEGIEKALPHRKTIDATEGLAAIRGVREKMGQVLKKDQALKISMYSPKTVERKEGDEWVDVNGKKWTRKNGINQSISNLQGAKIPWWCPKCDKIMNTKLDSKMWYKRSMCYDCVVADETEMRINGTWQEHQRQTMYANAISKLIDTIDELKSYQDTVSNPQIHFQDGRFEEWDTNIEQVKQDLQIEIEKFEGRLTELQDEVDGKPWSETRRDAQKVKK